MKLSKTYAVAVTRVANDDFRECISLDEYYCTNCNAILNEHFGFDPDGDSWSCTTCGQELFGDDVYDGDIYPSV